MSLASNYATVISGLDLKRVFSYMKAKGHLSLLPQIVRVLERERESGDVVIVAREEDAKSFKDARVVVDPRVVGGSIRRSGSKLTDASYRKALVGIYKAVTKS